MGEILKKKIFFDKDGYKNSYDFRCKRKSKKYFEENDIEYINPK